jgi:hypothetical protein
LFEFALDLFVLYDICVVPDDPLGHLGYLRLLAPVFRRDHAPVNNRLVLQPQLLSNPDPPLCWVNLSRNLLLWVLLRFKVGVQQQLYPPHRILNVLILLKHPVRSQRRPRVILSLWLYPYGGVGVEIGEELTPGSDADGHETRIHGSSQLLTLPLVLVVGDETQDKHAWQQDRQEYDDSSHTFGKSANRVTCGH